MECQVIVILFFFVSNVESHCVGTCYSGNIFPEPQDVFHGKHLKGFSYKNLTTDDPDRCYYHCVQDCRCKACQMKDARCELLDEDKTSKALTAGPGYVYFDLKQTMYKGVRIVEILLVWDEFICIKWLFSYVLCSINPTWYSQMLVIMAAVDLSLACTEVHA